MLVPAEAALVTCGHGGLPLRRACDLPLPPRGLQAGLLRHAVLPAGQGPGHLPLGRRLQHHQGAGWEEAREGEAPHDLSQAHVHDVARRPSRWHCLGLVPPAGHMVRPKAKDPAHPGHDPADLRLSPGFRRHHLAAPQVPGHPPGKPAAHVPAGHLLLAPDLRVLPGGTEAPADGWREARPDHARQRRAAHHERGEDQARHRAGDLQRPAPRRLRAHGHVRAGGSPADRPGLGGGRPRRRALDAVLPRRSRGQVRGLRGQRLRDGHVVRRLRLSPARGCEP
mmetsp:Transcript_12689/g.35071  ORF Transcript_12689/g.35071 Transcript_12689/m.35071 type:complete len:281 (+) Transcript_12689:1114-1956(+)